MIRRYILTFDTYMPRKLAPYLLILLAISSFKMEAQDEFAFTFEANGDQAYLMMPGALTSNFKTVSFWLKPEIDWDSTVAGETPILVKDKYYPNSSWGGRFQIFLSEGHIKWTMADYDNMGGSTIESDRSTWDRDVWYHLAFVLVPNTGMKMYVNGIEQADTDSRDFLPPPPAEGPDESFYFGCWGSTLQGQPKATIDEVRFWSVPRTQQDIRVNMCRRVHCANNVRASFNFNGGNTSVLGDECNVYSAIAGSASLTNHVIRSTAPVGDVSFNKYRGDWLNETLIKVPNRDTIKLSDVRLPGGEGIHIYANYQRPKHQVGIPDTVLHFDVMFGVWCTDVSGQYDLEVAMPRRKNAPGTDCDDCTYVLSRDFHNTNWNLRPEASMNCTFNFDDESSFGRNWREEYFVIDELYFNPMLPDTSRICSNQSGNINAFFMQNASYTWSDGVTGVGRSVNSSGTLWVKMEWKGCIKYDTTYVAIDPVPDFDWVNDTTICQGDSILLTCPLADGVTYRWDTGDTTRSIKVGRRGVYVLIVNNGKCSFSNYVTVRVIPSLEVELGPSDTLMCLGQDIEWDFIEGVGDYMWWNGNTGAEARVFNMPGTYWVSLENECFWVSDTITIDFTDCDCRVDIPNAFTPDDNYINDETGVYTRCYFQYYEFSIYDRWGNKVFYSDDPHARWDGTFRGMDSPEGVYIYELAYRRWTGPEEPVVKRGRMTLIR